MKIHEETDRKFRLGLMRRLSLIGILKEGFDGNGIREKSEASLAFRYLKNLARTEARPGAVRERSSIDGEVQLLAEALNITHHIGVDAALRYVDHFKDIQGVELILLILRGEPLAGRSIDAKLKSLSSIDLSMFTVEKQGIDQEQIRGCYSRTFDSHGIALPFGKVQMDQLLEVIGGKVGSEGIKGLSDLRQFTYRFLSNTWPLFSPSVLNIIFVYFQYHKVISICDIRMHYASLKKFGFERLHTRLVLLRAVNGDEPSKQFILDDLSWGDVGLLDTSYEIVRSFFRGEPSGIINPETLRSRNPIETAILLSIYINERVDEYDFIDRLIAAHQIDNSIPDVMNWDQYYEDVENLQFCLSPKLIFLAALLVKPAVRIGSRRVRSQYGPGGAGADLTRIATHIRKQTDQRSRFLSSFDSLPPSALSEVFWFMISPGMLDRMANIFPSNTSELNVYSSAAIRSLEMKDDCITYARRKGLISRSTAQKMLDEVRAKNRQIRFEDGENEGRLRIRPKEFSRIISKWLEPKVAMLRLRTTSDRLYRERRLDAHSDLLGRALSLFVCYSDQTGSVKNRFAFDILLGDKLRHNFLSIRLNEKMEQVFKTYETGIEVRSELSLLMEGYVDGFCAKWLTISSERSFVEKLATRLTQILRTWCSKGDQNLDDLSDVVADESLAIFDELLKTCRENWTDLYFPALQLDIKKYVSSRDDFQQIFLDRLLTSLGEGFGESQRWMKVNRDEYPLSVQVGDFVLAEAYNLKKNVSFRRDFAIHLYSSDHSGVYRRIDADFVVPGASLSPLLAIVDNLIPNACNSSGLGANTPMKVEIYSNGKEINLLFFNKISMTSKELIREKVQRAKKLLREPLDEKRLRSRGGTGFQRIRHKCEQEYQENFMIDISLDLTAEFAVCVECTLPIPSRVVDRLRR